MTSAKTFLFSPTNRSAMGVFWTVSGCVPMTSVHDGLTQRMAPSRLMSMITLSVCSAASRSSSLSPRMSSLKDRSMAPAV
jgi:hypothetical protein